MYLSFLHAEFKKWVRDPMLFFMLGYPLIIGLVGRYGLRYIEHASGISLLPYTDIVLVVLTLMTPHIFGALLGFSILDDRDDHIFESVQVTPLSVAGFLAFRVSIVMVLSLISTSFVIRFVEIGNLGWWEIVTVSFLSSLAAPATGLLINALATNKVEGFVAMKGVIGILIVFPVVSSFFTDAKEFFFALSPSFWPAKVLSSLVRGQGVLPLSTAQYYWFGVLYALLANISMSYAFKKRVRFQGRAGR